MVFLRFKTVFFVILLSAAIVQAQVPNQTEQDSLINETAMRDSSLARALSFKSYKPLTLIKTEKRLKYQLIKLVLLTDRKYLNFYQPTELMFEELDRFSEGSKKKMFYLALGGGIASQTLMYGRKFLQKKNIHFITPNLSGLHIYSKPLPFHSKAMFRLAGYNDFYFVTYLNNSTLTLTQRKTSYYFSRGLYWKFFKSFRFLYSNTKYSYTTFHNYGVTYYAKWISFYFVYQRNFENDKWNRIYIDWELRL